MEKSWTDEAAAAAPPTQQPAPVEDRYWYESAIFAFNFLIAVLFAPVFIVYFLGNYLLFLAKIKRTRIDFLAGNTRYTLCKLPDILSFDYFSKPDNYERQNAADFAADKDLLQCILPAMQAKRYMVYKAACIAEDDYYRYRRMKLRYLFYTIWSFDPYPLSAGIDEFPPSYFELYFMTDPKLNTIAVYVYNDMAFGQEEKTLYYFTEQIPLANTFLFANDWVYSLAKVTP